MAELTQKETEIVIKNREQMFKMNAKIISNYDYADTADDNENVREKINFSFLNQEKIKTIYELLEETILHNITNFNKKESERVPGKSNKELVEEIGNIRRHIKDLNLIFAFVHVLKNLETVSFSSEELKNIFQYVYDDINLEDKDTLSFINLLKDNILYNNELKFNCILRERVQLKEGKGSFFKPPLKTRQNRCIGQKLLTLNEETKNDEEFKAVISENKNRPRNEFIEHCKNSLNEMISPYKLDKTEKSWENVIYKILLTEENGLCKSVGDTQFGNVNIEFGINLNLYKFVIFRWGRWRVFDPINYVIKLDLTGNEVKDKELRENPFFTHHVYGKTPYYYHTVLRMLEKKCTDGSANPEKVFYYSIIHRTFFRESDLEPIKIYSKVDNEKAGCKSLKKLIRTEGLTINFEKNSNVKIGLLTEILKINNSGCNNQDEFLFPFVQEFYGAMDELRKSDKINIVEKMIFDDEQIQETLDNYRKK
jgi:hypothetical protein